MSRVLFAVFAVWCVVDGRNGPTQRFFEAQSVSHFEDSGAQAAVSSQDRPSEVEDHEVGGPWGQTMLQRSVHELQSLQWGQRLDECEKYCERAAKRLEKAKENVGEVFEGANSTRGAAEAAAQPVPQPTIPGTDELTQMRSHVAQLEAEISLKERIDLLMQEVAALKVRVPISGSGAETALVPVSRTGSALMSDLIEEGQTRNVLA